ncbi:MAG: hypothetical protein ACE5MG_09830 [Candidatus Methylomirabilales bacterium]
MNVWHWMFILVFVMLHATCAVAQSYRGSARRFARLPVSLSIVLMMMVLLASPWSSIAAPVGEKKVCDDLQGYKRILCHEAVEEKQKQRDSSSAAIAEIENVPEVVAGLKAKIGYLCKVQSGGSITCVRLSTLLGRLDNRDAILTVADLNQLQELFKLFQFSENVAVQCEADGPTTRQPEETAADSGSSISTSGPAKESQSGASIWTSVSVYDSEFEADGSISPYLAETLVTACDSLIGEGSHGTAELGAGPGDVAGGGGLRCALRIDEKTNEEIAEMALARAQEMRKQCETTLRESLMEGDDGTDDTGGPSNDTPDGPAGSDDGTGDGTDDSSDGPPADQLETIIDNGDGTETVCTEYGCFVRYKEKTRTRYLADCDSAKKECTWGQTDGNRNGNGLTETYKNGELIFKSVCKGGKCQTENYDSGGAPLPKLVPPTPKDCLDEACQSCVDFLEFHPKLVHDCSGGVGANFEICEEFAKAEACCSNPDAWAPDPLVVTPKNGAQDVDMNGLDFPIEQTVTSVLTPNPNEDGGMVCYNADLDVLALSCETQCSVAGPDGDCYARCVSRVVAVAEFGLLDEICAQAIHEGCFSGEVDFGIGGSEGPLGGTPPMPYLGDTKADGGSRVGTLQGGPRGGSLEVSQPVNGGVHRSGEGLDFENRIGGTWASGGTPKAGVRERSDEAPGGGDPRAAGGVRGPALKLRK